MRTSSFHSRSLARGRVARAVVIALIVSALPLAGQSGAQAKRPMTFLDAQNMRQVGAPDLSVDGRWLLYTLSVPDWKEARRQSDIYLVSTERGAASSRQLTFTKDKTETTPRWSRDGSFFVFASDRDATAGGAGREGGGGPAPRPVAAPNLPAGGTFGGGAGGPGNQLYVMRPDGSDVSVLLRGDDALPVSWTG